MSKKKKTNRKSGKKIILPMQFSQLKSASIWGDLTPRKRIQFGLPDVKLVGPTLPYGFDLLNIANRSLSKHSHAFSDSLQVFPYPDRKKIEVDANGYVKGYVMPAAGIDYAAPISPELRQVFIDHYLHGKPEIELPWLEARGRDSHQRLPSPQLIYQVIMAGLAGLTTVGYEGPLVLGSQNAEFLNREKANYCLEAWKAITLRHHLIFVSETDAEGLAVIGKACGYGHFCSKVNTRGQGVGFLVHPRLELIDNPVTFWNVAQVGGIHDLRPLYMLKLVDKTTKKKVNAAVGHEKSMRGGPAATAGIRHEQFGLAAEDLSPFDSVIYGGDHNCFLNNTTDTELLTKAGFKLVYPDNNVSTQQMGGRLDGWFTWQLQQSIIRYQVRNWWRNRLIGRAFSDHGLLTSVLCLDCEHGDCTSSDGDIEVKF